MTETRRVRVADIKADPDYRQKASDIAVRQTAKMWDDDFIGTIVVNERSDELYVIDGWMRLSTLAYMGVEEVTVEIEHLTREEEAREFIDRNTRSRSFPPRNRRP